MQEALRDYQKEMLERLHQAWEEYQSVMVQMPTGTGKTYLMAEAIRTITNQQETIIGGGVLIVAHRIELIEQISQTLDRFRIEHGLIVSGKPIDRAKQVQVASIQTLTRRIGTQPFFSPSLIIIDEAHHAIAKTYQMLWQWWPKAKFLGLTATPCRLSGEAFTDLFDTLLQSWSIREFIQKGWLSDLDYVSVRSDSIAVRKVASLNKRGADGDYQTKQVALVLDTEESIEHLYWSYKEFADGKRGIVYAINRDHARHIAEYYSERGLRCAVIDSKTPAKERRRIVEEYRNNVSCTLNDSNSLSDRGIDILVNVDIFSEGFDVPEVEFIQLARPTLSLSKYLQQVGRGMRVANGKQEVIILDQVGLYLMFSLPTSDRNWQGTFLGRISGKGSALDNKREPINNNREPIYNNSEPINNKRLVNEQMFRIKSVVGGKNQEKDLQSSVSSGNSEAQYALFAGDDNPSTMEFCEETAEKLKGALQTHRKVLVQVPPFIEKAQLIDYLMLKDVGCNEEHLSTEPQLTMVVVKRSSLIGMVEHEINKRRWLRDHLTNSDDTGMKRRPLYVCYESYLSNYLIDLVISYKPSMIVVWDANTARPNVYKNALQVWPNAKLVGLSLAPCDIKSTPNFRLFDMVLPSMSMKSYVDKGLVKAVEYVSVPPTGITNVLLGMLKPRMRPEDYVSKELLNRLTSLECMASLFKAYKEYADGKRGIVYAYDETHAEGIAEYYSRHGVPAKVFYDDAPSKPRFPTKDFYSGKLKVIVDAHGMSIDYPLSEVQFVQLAYPTQLIGEYLSLVAARMRVTTDFTNSERMVDNDNKLLVIDHVKRVTTDFTEGERKEYSDNKLLVIDHVKMGEAFGLPTDERDWQRLFDERRVKTEKEPEKPKINKPGKNNIANGDTTVTTKWQQRKERLLNASPAQTNHPDDP